MGKTGRLHGIRDTYRARARSHFSRTSSCNCTSSGRYHSSTACGSSAAPGRAWYHQSSAGLSCTCAGRSACAAAGLEAIERPVWQHILSKRAHGRDGVDTSGLDASAGRCTSAGRCPTAASRTASVNGYAAPSVACAGPSGRGGADATTAAAFDPVSPAAVRSCLAPSAAPRPQHPRPRLQPERRRAGVPEGCNRPRCTHQPTDAIRPPHGKGPRQGRAGRAWCARHGADSRRLGV